MGMSSASALILAAQNGDIASVQRLLADLQRSLRLTAALFLPSLRDVDAVVQRLGVGLIDSVEVVPVDDPESWLQQNLRAIITQRLDELERSPAYSGDPLGRMLLSSGRERLGKIPLNADPINAVNGRLRLMTKGAVDLLSLRFTNGIPFAQIATQRLLSLDDVTTGIQTACRQLDWLNDATEDALDPADYRALDGLVCGSEATSEGLGFLRTRMLDDLALALRVVLAARLHVTAAAWFAPALTIELPYAAQKSGSSVNVRRRSNPAVTSRIKRNRGFSTPTRRQFALRGDSGTYSVHSDRRSRSSLIPTLIGGALVLGGVLLLFLREGNIENRPAKPTVASNTTTQQQPTPPQKLAPTPPPTVPVQVPTPTQPSKSEKPSSSSVNTAPVIPPPDPEVVGSKPLFVPGYNPAPLAVWSTRLLVEGYSGPMLRVRRNNDNAEQDVSVRADGSLDLATLKSFAGQHSAHVMVWYDQSGNGHHLRQTDRNKQPLIINKGAIESENSRPVIRFDRDRFDHFITPGAIPIGCLYAVITVRLSPKNTQGIFGSLAKAQGRRNKQEAYYPLLDREGTGQCEWWVGNSDYSNIAVKAPIIRDQLFIWHSSSDGGKLPKLVLRLDGKQVGSSTLSSAALAPTGPTVVGAVYWDNALVDPFNGTMGEMYVLPPGTDDATREATYQNLKSWWKTP